MICSAWRCVIILVLCGLSSLLAWGDATTPATRDLVRTPDGLSYLWYRTNVTPEDLGLPFPTQGTQQDALAYRKRDRQDRDRLFLARVLWSTPQSPADVQAFYAAALGTETAQEIDPTTHVITLTAGAIDHFRLVEITPTDTGSAVKLEQVQRFAVPPRVYTPTEQYVLHVLDLVEQAYRHAEHVSYVMEQRVVLPDTPANQQPAALTWRVNYHRPVRLLVTAAVGDVQGLSITTETDHLRVHRQQGKDELRPFTGAITLEQLPELEDDPAAGLMLGNSLNNDGLDYIGLQGVPNVPAGQQADIMLEYPDWGETLHLIVDLPNRLILRAETTVTENGQTSTTIRTYTRMRLDDVAHIQPAKG